MNNKEEKYQTLIRQIALNLHRANVDTDLIYKIGEALQEHRPNKSKRFALIAFFKECGLK